MVKKIFRFKGKTEEELKAMSLEEFAKLLPAREKRSLKRGLTVPQKKFLEKMRISQKPAKTQSRAMIVIPEMIGKKVMIHSGKEWVSIEINSEMLGHRLGEFALTRRVVSHSAPGIGATKSSSSLSVK